ncbi:AAA family ATPase [Haliscomenobacter hydrossis]|uniref:SMC domain protein n=1 Tax=Haliscomenobacter hydrossis (strain ATCC 27775 / DSM 1100 / LMG 10767 / O) TaxID=760192 RepID=F4L290_HALH1|nr:AAA family ATPase [Haliscomenobacter hydrossis]AEE51697.1 SMC domain protein [Haliscomenobacter hydrossis DSM 1100]
MRITKLELKNFKRFTDLRIEHIPPQAKLVLLIGSNGSGKSSVFDAFQYLNSIKDGKSRDVQSNYFRKNIDAITEALVFFDDGSKVGTNGKANFSTQSFHTSSPFYGRTSFRQLSRLTKTSLGNIGSIQSDFDRPDFFIDRDNRFENDIDHITGNILKEVFQLQNPAQVISEKYINPINRALENIFGHANGTKLSLVEIIPPLEGKVAQVIFKKGTSTIHYDLLSAGEKEVFNVISNLMSRRDLFQETIYFFDEMDLHLNTKIQYNLLKEITENWIPEKSQLWTASHSLGFIEYAKHADQAIIIDFDDYDFDQPKVLTPEAKDNPDIYEIAVGKEFLSSLFRSMDVYFVENKDQDYYAVAGIDKAVFVAEKDRNSVFHKVRSGTFKGIVDRDYLSDEDIELIKAQYPNLFVLPYYSIENLLYHPANLADYYKGKNQSFDKGQYIDDLRTAKDEVVERLAYTLATKRLEYPYFGEPEFLAKPLQNRFKNKQENFDQAEFIGSSLKSSNFEDFYKNLPMKSYCTHLQQRQNIPKSDLAKTKWFHKTMSTLLQK